MLCHELIELLLSDLSLQLVNVNARCHRLRSDELLLHVLTLLQVFLDQARILLLLQLGELYVAVVAHELLDAHEAAANADDQSPVDDLGRDLLCAEVVLIGTDAHHRHGAAQSVDVVCEKLIDNITDYSLVKLSRLLLLLELGSDLLVLLLALFYSARDVLKLPDESDDLLLRLPIHLEKPEDGLTSLGNLLSLQTEIIEFTLSIISVAPDFCVLLLHLLYLLEDAVELILDKG